MEDTRLLYESDEKYFIPSIVHVWRFVDATAKELLLF